MAAITNMMQPVVTMLMGDPEKNTCPQPSQTGNNEYAATFKMAYHRHRGDASVAQNSRLFFFLLAASTVASFFDGTTMGFVDSGMYVLLMTYYYTLSVKKLSA